MKCDPTFAKNLPGNDWCDHEHLMTDTEQRRYKAKSPSPRKASKESKSRGLDADLKGRRPPEWEAFKYSELAFCGGRYRTRTCDLCRVKAAL